MVHGYRVLQCVTLLDLFLAFELINIFNVLTILVFIKYTP